MLGSLLKAMLSHHFRNMPGNQVYAGRSRRRRPPPRARSVRPCQRYEVTFSRLGVGVAFQTEWREIVEMLMLRGVCGFGAALWCLTLEDLGSFKR